MKAASGEKGGKLIARRVVGAAPWIVRWSLIGMLFSAPAFAAGVVQGGVVPGMGATAPAYGCIQNCPPGDEKCLQACTNLNAPKRQQPSPPNFQCVNQCTQAGYAFAYCRKLCSP